MILISKLWGQICENYIQATKDDPNNKSDRVDFWKKEGVAYNS